jgi:hypothetical protein
MKLSPGQKRNAMLVLALGAAAIYYSSISRHGLKDSAALYMGVPVLIALGLSLSPETESVTGATMKAITIALLLAVPVFGEGYICILFTAPIFYLVGGIVAGLIDYVRIRKKRKTTLKVAAITTFLALLSLEGTTNFTTFPRFTQLEVSKVIVATPAQVKQQIARVPIIPSEKPLFLKIFPYPVTATGEGLNIGDQRDMHFVAYKHIWWDKVEGDLILKVSDVQDRSVTFSAVKDDSYISHYLKWENSNVSWERVDDSHTRVTWRIAYERTLDPSWYFGPMQYYAVKLSAEQMIDNVATPPNKS